jgi:plasmid stabilization system protein ParE
MGHAGVPELAQAMNLEWSDEAIADLDRFVEFLNREHPSLASVVAAEIVDKVQVLSAHPQLGRPIAGREEYRQIVCRFSARRTCFNIASMAVVL